ncbi:phosphotransferase [Cryobacterium sp. CG_9.6]|uniref:phosphotransferase n=1 Tax=Cryobacterium sp. CG_9.6 TaxID=2760710 RepID=UPI002474F537|nr:phosphotransferase [Cryobacterium sp. CG_9.6]MDH6235607.1 aminoglycoside phosphotransferase (APT) family kinase protein [Cryobacterium sp. CG_9.6]
MLVNHGDLGPWNTLHDGFHLTGVIDWDLARFGSPLDDLAQIALEAVPLKPSTVDRLAEGLNQTASISNVDTMWANPAFPHEKTPSIR